mmetsp:Transcript_41250/g.96973  ORF Transcript_41250/g.96973 Transcript_41250/m.96973 type:complete len:211 (-) Transcript_41250:19-651(-)
MSLPIPLRSLTIRDRSSKSESCWSSIFVSFPFQSSPYCFGSCTVREPALISPTAAAAPPAAFRAALALSNLAPSAAPAEGGRARSAWAFVIQFFIDPHIDSIPRMVRSAKLRFASTLSYSPCIRLICSDCSSSVFRVSPAMFRVWSTSLTICRILSEFCEALTSSSCFFCSCFVTASQFFSSHPSLLAHPFRAIVSRCLLRQTLKVAVES